MGREIQEEQWRSVRRGALLRSMSPVVGLRPPSPPLLPLRRAPHRPDRAAPCGFGGSRPQAYPAKDGGYPTPGSKGGRPVHFRPGGHGGSRIPAVLGARRRQSHVSCVAEDAQRHGALRCVDTLGLEGEGEISALERERVATQAWATNTFNCTLWVVEAMLLLMLQALIFDVDGTLADTERDGHRPAFNAAFAEAGLAWRWDEALYGELLAVAGGKERIRFFCERHAPEFLRQRYAEARIKDLHAAKTRHYVALCARGIPLRPGVERLLREFKVGATVGRPQVAYKETITKSTRIEGKFIQQSGGHGQYGHCWLRIEPKGRGEGYEFINKVKGGAIPREFIPAIEKGVKEAMENGIFAGFPMVDISVAVYDGTFHDVDSSEMAFKIAGSMALQAAVKQASPVLLEPIMKIEVTAPEEFMGDVIGDLSSKRAQILGTKNRGKAVVINSLVPLAEMSGYVTTLRGMTKGRASYYMEPSHYQEVPNNIALKIIEVAKPNSLLH